MAPAAIATIGASLVAIIVANSYESWRNHHTRGVIRNTIRIHGIRREPKVYACSTPAVSPQDPSARTVMNYIHSFIDPIRDRLAPINNTSNFRESGEITPEEFQAAGDFLVHKFPSWSWADASSPSQRVSYFPVGKQYLVTRGVPCRKRIKSDDFAGTAADADDEDGWVNADLIKDVKTVEDDGNLGDNGGEEDEIPDMDDEDDEEAIIRDTSAGKKGADELRTYTLYITYTPYYRTPRLYLLGYDSNNQPLPPLAMMEDIVGDYKDKTVTLEDFNFTSPPIKTASVHPCKHASVMKVLLDRADAALKLRIDKLKGKGKEGGDAEWEVLPTDGTQDEEEVPAIRVDQYLVVFIKFMASVTPGIEHDFTMGV